MVVHEDVPFLDAVDRTVEFVVVGSAVEVLVERNEQPLKISQPTPPEMLFQQARRII